MKVALLRGLTLLFGIAVGVLAWQLSLPLLWMLGPMIGTTLLAVMGVSLASPDRLRPMVMPVTSNSLSYSSRIRPAE